MDITESIYTDFMQGHPDSLYAEAWPDLLAYAARCLGPRYAMMAEDCVQDAMVQVYHRREQFASAQQLKFYLLSSIHNKCISTLRRGTVSDSYRDQLTTVEREFTASLIEQETIDMMLKAIAALPEKYRQIFELGFEQGLRNQEAADQLGISLASFNKRKRRMIELLREELKDQPAVMVLLLAQLTLH